MKILDYCLNEYVALSMKEFGLNPIHYVSLPGYSFECWPITKGVSLETKQDKQTLDDFIAAKRGGIHSIMGDRYVIIKSNDEVIITGMWRSMTGCPSGT